MVQLLWGAVWRHLKKFKKEIPPLGIYLKKPKTLIQKDISIPMFSAALFTIAKIWKQPKCPCVAEWSKKGVVDLQNGILLHHKKEDSFTLCDSTDEPTRYYV